MYILHRNLGTHPNSLTNIPNHIEVSDTVSCGTYASSVFLPLCSAPFGIFY